MDAHAELIRDCTALLGLLLADDATLDPLETGVFELFELLFTRPANDQGFVKICFEGRRRVSGMNASDRGAELHPKPGGEHGRRGEKVAAREMVVHTLLNSEPKSYFDNRNDAPHVVATVQTS